MSSPDRPFARRRLTVCLPALLAALALTVPAGLAAQETSIAVIDVARILEESGRGLAALGELRVIKEGLEAELDALGEEIAALRERAAEGRLSLSEDKIAELERELEDEDNAIALQRRQDDGMREFNEKRTEKLQEIEALVMPLINEIGTEMGLTAIFNKYQSGLVYADAAADITDLVLTRFDEKHPAE